MFDSNCSASLAIDGVRVSKLTTPYCVKGIGRYNPGLVLLEIMNKDIEKNRSFGCRIIKLSPLLMLLLGVVVSVGQLLIGFQNPFIVAMFLLGWFYLLCW